MKISGAIIQNKMISEYTESDFVGKYKGREIEITTNHGFGKPEYDHLKRFYITVRMFESGIYDVDTYQDFHNIKDAIRYALIGACLIK